MDLVESTTITDLIEKNFFGQEISSLLKDKGRLYLRDDSQLDSNFKTLTRPARMCFKNCVDLALKYPNQLTYVEGYAYASFPIPINHGWLITGSGQVVDPTWNQGSNYFGIPFNNSKLVSCLEITKSYGFIDQLWLNKKLAQKIQST